MSSNDASQTRRSARVASARFVLGSRSAPVAPRKAVSDQHSLQSKSSAAFNVDLEDDLASHGDLAPNAVPRNIHGVDGPASLQSDLALHSDLALSGGPASFINPWFPGGLASKCA